MNSLHMLSHSNHSEMVVLGYAISRIDGLKVVCAHLQKGDFYSELHQRIFTAILQCYQEGGVLSIYRLCDAVQEGDSELDGKSYLIRVTRLFFDPKQAKECIEEVKRLSLLRRILMHDIFTLLKS